MGPQQARTDLRLPAERIALQQVAATLAMQSPSCGRSTASHQASGRGEASTGSSSWSTASGRDREQGRKGSLWITAADQQNSRSRRASQTGCTQAKLTEVAGAQESQLVEQPAAVHVLQHSLTNTETAPSKTNRT